MDLCVEMNRSTEPELLPQIITISEERSGLETIVMNTNTCTLPSVTENTISKEGVTDQIKFLIGDFSDVFKTPHVPNYNGFTCRTRCQRNKISQ